MLRPRPKKRWWRSMSGLESFSLKACCPAGIRVNAVAPGSVKTKLRAEIMAANPARAEANLAKIPMQRFGTPEDMAGAVSFLASPAAAYVNGHILAVDGGLTIS